MGLNCGALLVRLDELGTTTREPGVPPAAVAVASHR